MSSHVSFNNAVGKAKVLGAFGLAEHEAMLMRLLTQTRSMIAGGAALTWWQAAHDPSVVVPEGQDLDIWVLVPSNDTGSRYYPTTDVLDLLWEMFLRGTAGFHKQTRAERAAEMTTRRTAGEFGYGIDAPTYRVIKDLIRIQNYIHPTSGRKVQLIFVRTDKIMNVLDRYDLDICRFNIQQKGRELYVFNPPAATTADLEAMRAGRMRLFNVRDNRVDGTCRRVAKYYGRGYYFVEAKPCPTCFHVEKKKLTAEEAQAHVEAAFAEEYEASRLRAIAVRDAAVAAGGARAKLAARAPPALVFYDEDEDEHTPRPVLSE